MSAFDPESITQRAAFRGDLEYWGPDSAAAKTISLADSQEYCRQLAVRHYENFSIASFLIPRNLRRHFYAIYAYCRWSDDLADEVGSKEESLRYLRWWSEELDRCYAFSQSPMNAPQPTHPVMVALADTFATQQLSKLPFQNLLDAFRQDQGTTRYETDADLLAYCERSANPVGRILLQLAKVDSPSSLVWSDAICTGLQLANFCQDMSRDAAMGRIYFPRSRWRSLGLDEETLLTTTFHPRKGLALQEWVDDARAYLEIGRPLASFVPRWLQRDILLFLGGGLAILDAIERNHFDVWSRRVHVTPYAKGSLLLRSLLVQPGQIKPETPKKSETENVHKQKSTERSELAAIRASQAYSRWVAKRSGSSFYRSFDTLRPEKQKGMMSLYAFARLVDDVSDSTLLISKDRDTNQHQLQKQSLEAWHDWIDSLHDPIDLCSFPRINQHGDLQRYRLRPSMKETVERFGIPLDLLHGIVNGSLSDIQSPFRLESLESLRGYCYQVASTVGLSCLHIWRGEIEKARQAAIECGMAFQWTNILRDIGEDADRGRIYFPMQEFVQFGVDPDAWLKRRPSGDWKGLLKLQFERAHASYQMGWQVIDWIEPDGKRMFSLMWKTYHQLLIEIEKDSDRIWEERVSLSNFKKLTLVGAHFFSPFFVSNCNRTMIDRVQGSKR